MNVPENYPEVGEETAENLEPFRDFKGIWIPKEIWLSPLSALEKCVVAEIDSLSRNNEGCFASNKWLARFFGLSENRITCILTKLKKIGILTQESFDGRHRIIRADLLKTQGQKQKGRPFGSKRADLLKTQGQKQKGRPFGSKRADLLEVKGLGNVNCLAGNGLQRPLITKVIAKPIKKVFSADDNKFDPEDLPAHIGKYPAVVKAWSEFVKHRKDKHAPLTELACKKLFKKMVRQSPENIIRAIDKAIESGWRGLFFQDDGEAKTDTVSPRRSSAPLDPDGQRLNEFVSSALGGDIVSPDTIARFIRQMHEVYDRAGRVSIPYYPDKHPNDHFPWSRFFREWVEFLEEKQRSGFVLRSVHDLELSGCRWREYMQYCASCTNYNWETGQHHI